VVHLENKLEIELIDVGKMVKLVTPLKEHLIESLTSSVVEKLDNLLNKT
jgi:hypothetical protein